MNYEVIGAFVDGLLIGILLISFIYKILFDSKMRNYEKTIRSVIDKLLAESEDDLPIEKEDELL